MSADSSPKLGMLLPFGPGLVSSPLLREFAGILEAENVESVWAVEHVVVAASYEPNYPYSADGRMPSAPGAVPMPDPLEVLAHLAATTERLRLGTCVVVAPLHSPVVLAKRVATLDLLSAGRSLLGLGIGWQPEEYAAVGVPFEGRGRRLEECVGAMRALWANDPATYEGDTVSFRDLHLTLQAHGWAGADHPRRQFGARHPPGRPHRRRLVPLHDRAGRAGSRRRPLASERRGRRSVVVRYRDHRMAR
jgi:alkanesulfonate monooxygenase SsuD/methylene tetrahydromethanopterin reductase-like flavin-dependent oxidoreductase (luciferase family)